MNKKIIFITIIVLIIYSKNFSTASNQSEKDFSPPRLSTTPVKNKNMQQKRKKIETWKPPQNKKTEEKEKQQTPSKQEAKKQESEKNVNKHVFYMQVLNREINFIQSFHNKIITELKTYANAVIETTNLKSTRKTLARMLKSSKLFSATFLAYSPRAASKRLTHYMLWFVKKRNKIIRLYPNYKKYNYLKMRWFLKPLRTAKMYYTKPYRENKNTLMISAVIPVIKNGEKIAVIGADINFNRIAGKISGMRFGKKGFAFLVKGDGTIMAHPNEKYISRKNLFRFKQPNGLFNTGEPDKQIYALARVMLKQRKKNKAMITDSKSGRKYIAYFGPVMGTDWALCIMIRVN